MMPMMNPETNNIYVVEFRLIANLLKKKSIVIEDAILNSILFQVFNTLQEPCHREGLSCTEGTVTLNLYYHPDIEILAWQDDDANIVIQR